MLHKRRYEVVVPDNNGSFISKGMQMSVMNSTRSEKYHRVKKKVLFSSLGHTLWKYLAVVFGPSSPISSINKYIESIFPNHSD